MTGVPGQGFQVMPVDGVAVVIAPAEMDVANAGALRDAITSAGTGRATIVVDMTATEFCDSSGLSEAVAKSVGCGSFGVRGQAPSVYWPCVVPG